MYHVIDPNVWKFGPLGLCMSPGCEWAPKLHVLAVPRPTFPWFWDFISRDFFTIVSMSEDNCFLMGGSDVVHCVQVSLNGTTVAAFGRMRISLGLFCTLHSLYAILWTLGALYDCLVMGPRPSNVAMGI